MRASFLWSAPTGYLAACLIELAKSGWELQLLSRDTDPGAAALFRELDAALDWHRLAPSDYGDAAAVRDRVTAFSPDSIVVSGWHNPAYKALVGDPAMARTGRAMTLDTPWRGTLRQRLGRYRIAGYLRRMHAIVPSGERARQAAINLGAPPERIHNHFCGYDAEGFAAARIDGARPEGFLFVGRYAPEKGLATLDEAYRRYRAAVEAPWPLHLCGRGTEDGGLAGAEGVTDHGFVAPEDLPGVMRAVGCFVFPSLYEPFGVALLEAAGAGLPVIASDAVGASVECLRDHASGYLFPAGDPGALAERMERIHRAGPERRAEMGRLGQGLAEPFAARYWALRFDDILRRAAAAARA